MNKAGTFFLAFIFFCLQAASAAQGMEPLSGEEMESVCASGGVTLDLSNVRIYKHQDYWTYHGADGGSLRVSGSLYSNGDKGWLNLADVSGMTLNTTKQVYLDVFSNPDGRPMLGLQVPGWTQQIYMNAQSLSFSGQDLGMLNISYPVAADNPSSFALYTTPLDSGIGLQLELSTVFDQFQLRYQEHDWTIEKHFLTIGDLHIADHFDNNGNDVGNLQIGDLNPRGQGTYNPMEIHVAEEVRTYQDETGQDYDQRVSFLRLEMPMEGSIRLGTLQIGPNYGVLPANQPTEFGPIHIDGINAHRLTVDLIAGRENI